MQMKRRQRARELPACLQETSTPYLTTIHASRNNICLSEPQRSVWPVCQSVFRTNLRILLAEARKRTGRMFSRHSHVQGPVENHAQIPKRIFVMKGGPPTSRTGTFSPAELKCTTSDLKVLAIKCLFLAYTTNRHSPAPLYHLKARCSLHSAPPHSMHQS